MIVRLMYAAYAKAGETYRDLGNPSVTHLSLSRFTHPEYGDILFLYAEADREDIRAEEVIGGETVPFPNGERWVWVPELYHFSKPLSKEHWERKQKKTPWVRVNRIRHDRFASYVFYHHRLQEEKPGNGDKYGIIGLFGELLFLYLELPEEKETVRYAGELSTHDTPSTEGKPSEWDKIMTSHFRHWEDDPEEWREIPTLLFR